MRRPLRTLFYGRAHEHAPGKIASLAKLRDDFDHDLRVHGITLKACGIGD